VREARLSLITSLAPSGGIRTASRTVACVGFAARDGDVSTSVIGPFGPFIMSSSRVLVDLRHVTACRTRIGCGLTSRADDVMRLVSGVYKATSSGSGDAFRDFVEDLRPPRARVHAQTEFCTLLNYK
jgi:hypothetical protein